MCMCTQCEHRVYVLQQCANKQKTKSSHVYICIYIYLVKVQLTKVHLVIVRYKVHYKVFSNLSK